MAARLTVILLAVFLVVSLAANAVLFRQAAQNAATLSAVQERLNAAQDDRSALEARVVELGAENQRLRTASPSTSPAATAAPSPEAVLLERIEEQVIRLRSLDRRGDVPLRFLDRDSLRAYFVDSFDRDYLPLERETDQKLLVALGLIGPDQNLVQIMLDLLQEQVLGIYDEDEKTMYVVQDQGQLGVQEKQTFAHEFVHALQDQHFDLARLAPKHPENADRSLAIHAVVEGDAVLSERVWAQNTLSDAEKKALEQDTGGDSSKIASAPNVIRTELLFPYLNGYDFVQRAYRRSNGFQGVDEVFRNPPDSTEQILHPEKYWDREAPIEVTLPDLAAALGEGWRTINTNVLGELDTRILLEQYGNRTSAVRASTGWGGDRWQLLERDGRQAVVLKSVWDTENDAREFFDAYSQGLRSRFSGARQDVATSTRLALTAETAAVELRSNGRDVLAVISFDRASAEALADQVLQAGG